MLSICLLAGMPMRAQWQPVGERIKTRWAEQVSPENTLPEYPRPTMQRAQWMNLNGLWSYAITTKKQSYDRADGQILVPFAVESSLSGVGKTLGKDKCLWYEREFLTPASWQKQRVLLHFGAVDWLCDVWVNDIKVGRHQGGYTPFTFDITAALHKGVNTLKVRVWDPTDDADQPRGKQVNSPRGIWYSAVSGIWQTVWLEPVPKTYISHLRIIPDFDQRTFNVDIDASAPLSSDAMLEVEVFDEGKSLGKVASLASAVAEFTVAEPKAWTPDTPFLYTMSVRLVENGKELDRVESYSAMRKISVGVDSDGVRRMRLNNCDQFQFGPLDQGWWPDGLYTAPTDEALASDIIKTKEWGFNMIRKHVKVEPERWYYHCDRLGILVWQDMPSGGPNPKWMSHSYFENAEAVRSPQSEANFRQEWKEIIDLLVNHPSIVVWVPFNEAWGQFKTREIADWTKGYDPSRLVNAASGGNFYLDAGDILDLHNYPGPDMYLYDTKRVNVLGEYGGIGLVVKGHVWEPDRNWGYVQYNTSTEVTDQYVLYGEQLLDFIRRGFSAAVYTQTTDVDIEVNGLMTYDREVDKVDVVRVREINRQICNSLAK